jgi:hypothetical protein
MIIVSIVVVAYFYCKKNKNSSGDTDELNKPLNTSDI